MSNLAIVPERSIPCNIEAERAVLGSLMIDPDAMEKVIEWLLPRDFYRERNGWVFDVLRTLYERHEPLSFVLIVDELELRGKLNELGGPAYLTDIVASTPTALYIEHYARIVQRDSILRRLIAAGGQIAEMAYDLRDRTADEILDNAEKLLAELSLEAATVEYAVRIDKLLPGEITRIENAANQATGIPTGYTQLDLLLGGMHKTDLLVLAARPGIGKTTAAQNICYNSARLAQARSLIISLEMSKSQMLQRFLAMHACIDSNRLRSGNVLPEEWPDLLAGADFLSSLPIGLADPPVANVQTIARMARKWARQEGLDILVVDYMQLIRGSTHSDTGNRQQEISFISRELKALARELQIIVIAISQLSRSVESRNDKRPVLSDLRESGQIEQDADGVIFLYREDYYVPDTERQNIVDLLLAKHRHGDTGTVSVYARNELCQFRDLEITNA